MNTWKIWGMLIVYWPITIKFWTCKQTSKPQTNYRCCLQFSYLVPYSWFCKFHSKLLTLYVCFIPKKNARQNVIKWTIILTFAIKKWCWGNLAKAVYTFRECSSTEILYRWCVTTLIGVSFLIGHATREICCNQPRVVTCHQFKFLQSFHKCHLLGNYWWCHEMSAVFSG